MYILEGMQVPWPQPFMIDEIGQLDQILQKSGRRCTLAPCLWLAIQPWKLIVTNIFVFYIESEGSDLSKIQIERFWRMAMADIVIARKWFVDRQSGSVSMLLSVVELGTLGALNFM